jgi:hypothetical protein
VIFETSNLRDFLAGDFPPNGEELLPFCLDDNGRHPALREHVDLAISSAGLTCTNDVVADLHRGYNYLVTFFLSVDSVIDGHSRGKGHDVPTVALPYLGALITKSIFYIERAAKQLTRNKDCEWLRTEFRDIHHRNAVALRAEKKIFHDHFAQRSEDEHQMVIGRLAFGMFIFKILWSISGKPNIDRLVQYFGEYTNLLQECDDIIDWRDDYHSQRWTPFLRDIFRSRQKLLSIDELERAIYLEGGYETAVAGVIRSFQELAARFAAINDPVMAKCMHSESEVATQRLREFVSCKLSTIGAIIPGAAAMTATG